MPPAKRRRRPGVPGVAAALAVCALLVLDATAARADVLRWRVNSLLHPHLFGEAGERFAAAVGRLSGGSFVVEVHDRMVLDQDTFDALEAGLVDAAWGSAGHHHREDAALTLFSGFPFGPDPQGFTAWMREEGGEALEAIYARHGLKSLYCGVLPEEGGGWFTAPVASVADLDGLSMRSFGYGARVLGKLGVVAYELPADEIRPALASGLISAAEFSLPSIDAELGIADVARHLYLPGWQQPATSLEILVTLRTWDGLGDARRKIVEAACAEVLDWSLAEATARQDEALARFRATGVRIHRWPDEVLDALRAAWDEVVAEEAAADPAIAAAWEGYLRHVERRAAGGVGSPAGSAPHAGETEAVENHGEPGGIGEAVE